MQITIGALRHQKLAAWIGGLLLIPILTTLFLQDLDDLGNFSGDETLWLPVSDKLFRLYVIEHNFDDPAWYDEYSTFGSRQPQIGKYLIGLGTYLGGWVGEPYTAYYYDWGHDFTWNQAHKGVPPAAMVRTGRLPVAIMGVVACLVFYWLAVLLTDWWNALLSVAILVGGRLVLTTSRVAMIDTPALAFGLMALVGMVYLLRALRAERLRKAIALAVPTGIAAGFAIGTKLNALLIVAVCLLLLGGEAIVQVTRRPRRALAALSAGGMLSSAAWLVFYLSNPFLYGNAVAGTRHLWEMGSIVATIPIQQLTTPSERVQAIWNHLLLYAPLAQLGLPYDRWLILGGGLLLIRALLRRGRDLRWRHLDIVAVWTCIAYLGSTLWLPHPWERYYLPLQPCNALLEAIAVSWLLRGLWKLISRPWRTTDVPAPA